jgi:hypothetical protein
MYALLVGGEKERRYSDGPGALMRAAAARGRVRPSHTFNWGHLSRPVASAHISSPLTHQHSADCAANLGGGNLGRLGGAGSGFRQRRLSDGPGAVMLGKYIRPGTGHLAESPRSGGGGVMGEGGMGMRMRRKSERRNSIGPQAILEDSALVVEEPPVQERPRPRASRTFHVVNLPQEAAAPVAGAGFACGAAASFASPEVLFSEDLAPCMAAAEQQGTGAMDRNRGLEVRPKVRRARTFNHGNSSRPVAAINLNELHAHGPSYLSTPAAARRQAAEAALAAAGLGGGGQSAAVASGGRGSGGRGSIGSSQEAWVPMRLPQGGVSLEAAAVGHSAASSAAATDGDQCYEPGADVQGSAGHVLRLPRAPAVRRLSSLSLASSGSFDGSTLACSGPSRRRPSFLFASGLTSPSAENLLSSSPGRDSGGQSHLSGGIGSFGSGSSRVELGEEACRTSSGEHHLRSTVASIPVEARGIEEEQVSGDGVGDDRSQQLRLVTERAERELSGDTMLRAGSQGLPIHEGSSQQVRPQQHQIQPVAQSPKQQEQQQGRYAAVDKLIRKGSLLGVTGLRSMSSDTGSLSSSEGSSFKRMTSNLSDRLRMSLSSSVKVRNAAQGAPALARKDRSNSSEFSSISRGSSHASKAVGGSWPHRSPAVPLGAESCPSQDPLAPIRQLVMQLQENAEMEREMLELNHGALSVAAIWKTEEQQGAQGGNSSGSAASMTQEGSPRAGREHLQGNRGSTSLVSRPTLRPSSELSRQQTPSSGSSIMDLARQHTGSRSSLEFSSRGSGELNRQRCNALQQLNPAALAGAAEQAMRRHRQGPRRHSNMDPSSTAGSSAREALVSAWVQGESPGGDIAGRAEGVRSSGFSGPLKGLKTDAAAVAPARARRMSLAFEPQVAAPLLSADHLRMAVLKGPQQPMVRRVSTSSP